MATGEQPDRERLVVIGRITGAHGVRGALRIYSYTEPPENIFEYGRWYLHGGDDWSPVACLGGQRHGKGLLGWIEGVEDRDAALRYRNVEIAVPRDALPEPEHGVWYWVDLVGCRVENLEGVVLGVVTTLMETGAHDVLVVEHAGGERLVPFAYGPVVKEVDLEARRIRVEWHPDD